MVPLRVGNLCRNWTAGLLQKDGYSLGFYSNGSDVYSALGVDATSNAHVPLFTGRGAAHVIAGHPVAALHAQEGTPACEVFVQLTHVDSVPGVRDTWHVSVNNPTESEVTIRLASSFGLPGMQDLAQLGALRVKAGGLVDVL